MAQVLEHEIRLSGRALALQVQDPVLGTIPKLPPRNKKNKNKKSTLKKTKMNYTIVNLKDSHFTWIQSLK